MGIFDKVFASLRGGKNAGDSGHDKAAANENCISRQDNLKRMIELLLKKNYKGGNFSFDDKILRILITDSIQYYSLIESGFKTDLIIYLDGQMGINFAEVDICTGPLPETHNMSQLDEGAYMDILTKERPVRMSKAEIFVQKNYGTLKMDKYEIDSEAINELPSKRYNIGAGEYPEIAGRFRQNHIAIDDDPESEGYERNKHVSRTHAYIRYSTENGFLLQAEPEGTVKAGMRTRILRADSEIEVDDVVPQPLHNGDCIELSKNVRLIFKVLS